MIPPDGAVARSRNLGQTFLAKGYPEFLTFGTFGCLGGRTLAGLTFIRELSGANDTFIVHRPSLSLSPFSFEDVQSRSLST